MIVESYEDVIVLSGALRSNFWETIHTAISLTLRRHATGVIIDCSGITECTPEGGETFRDALDFISNHDARIIVAAVPEFVLDVLKTVPHVRSQLAIARSVEEARTSLDCLSEMVAKKPNSPELKEKLMVLVLDCSADLAALRHATMIADTIRIEIDVVFPLIVPRDLPLQAPLPDQEAKAVQTLEEARTFLEASNPKPPYRTKLERGRDIASTIVSALQEDEAQQVIVPISAATDDLDETAKLTKSVLSKVQTQVMFVSAKKPAQ